MLLSVIFHPVIVTGDVPELAICTHSLARSRSLIYTPDCVDDETGVAVGVGVGVGVCDGVGVGVGV